MPITDFYLDLGKLDGVYSVYEVCTWLIDSTKQWKSSSLATFM